MANLLLVVDPDAERRDRFIAKIERLLPPLDGLRTERCAAGDFCALWAQEPRAPISRVADAQSAAIIWGDAISGTDSARVDAGSLRTLWAEPFTSAVLDGIHVAAVYEQHGG
ncbi:MAG: hypothetical protein ACREIV_16710, partial [Planctomycetaceae bacterium]